jgi:hypothetical protein
MWGMTWRAPVNHVVRYKEAVSRPTLQGVIENNVSTDGQIGINRQIDIRELRVNAHTIVCGRSAITNRVCASV